MSNARELAQIPSTLHVDSTNNRVGIGTTSPSDNLVIDGGTLNGTTYVTATNNHSDQFISMGINGDVGEIAVDDGDVMTFGHYNNYASKTYTEHTRIDSSGNVLIGMTSGIGTFTNSGVGISSSSNYIHAIRDGGPSIFVGRESSDGEIIRIYKSGSFIGKIGTFNGYPFYGHATQSGAGLMYVSTTIRPFDCNTQTQSDNAFDLGTGSTRFDDIYATNGTIQTSDQNEKQQIDSLTSAEITAAKAISKLFKTFKWNDKVEAKGDAARTHTGVIAQDVQQAMTDAGLDAGDYAFFISATWWEAQTEVPAVEADEENGIEAADAYTRTDTYDTAEEAPEGATERTRLGIRYPELLAFVGAATEQRLADIETRIAALEAE